MSTFSGESRTVNAILAVIMFPIIIFLFSWCAKICDDPWLASLARDKMFVFMFGPMFLIILFIVFPGANRSKLKQKSTSLTS